MEYSNANYLADNNTADDKLYPSLLYFRARQTKLDLFTMILVVLFAVIFAVTPTIPWCSLAVMCAFGTGTKVFAVLSAKI